MINPWQEIYKNYGKAKKATTYNPKTKLPTASKTKKCTYCGKSGTTIMFGKEKRTLCRDHIIQLNSKHDTYEAVFTRANKL